MKALASPMAVADYCHGLRDKKIIVNDEYQRKDGLWTGPAKSFFIESILLQYPIPKLFLYSKLDLKTRETIKEIVDGQQRSQALLAFFEGRLALSKTIDTPELRGMRYSRLPDDLKTSFLSYQLPIDQFSGVPEDEVREAFRRINSNNVPLNAEEQRNARYQGEFKWFVTSISELYKEKLLALGLLSKRDVIRMADLRLYAEMALSLDSGFQTVKAANLDRIYKKYNASFDLSEDYREKIFWGIDFVLERTELHAESLLRMHIFESMALAAIALRYPEQPNLQAEQAFPEIAARVQTLNVTLDLLVSSLMDPEASPQLADFVKASTEATNTATSRATRFLYLKHALSQLD